MIPQIPYLQTSQHPPLLLVTTSISQILQPDFNFGFGLRDSKLSARRVPRETQATELSVPLEVFSDRSAGGDPSMHLLTL